MTRTLLASLCFALALSASDPAPSAAAADDVGGAPTGRQIMEWVDERDDGDRATQDMQMVLIDKNGGQRKRTMRMFAMDKGEDSWSIMFFLDPADVKDTGFLTYDYDDTERDDDQWLYLPALKKTKRIASGDKSGAFMGSDFTYSDMTDRNLDRYDYKLLQEDEVDGNPVWIVEAVPNDPEEIEETGYTKQIVFVRQDNHVVVRAKSWVKKGKRNKYFDVKKLELIDGIWTPTEMHMTTKKGSKTLHKTILISNNVKYDQEMNDDVFSVRKLEQGL